MTSTIIPTDANNSFIYENVPNFGTTPIYLPTDSTESLENIYFQDKGYYIEEDNDYNVSDLIVVILACLATLIPLVIIWVIFCGIRIACVKYQRRKAVRKYDGILARDMTNDSTKPLHSHLLSSDKLSQDTQLEIIPEPVEICDNVAVNTTQTRSNHSSTNGSIITMTLKNNHLIVETEERNDIEENCRETTMRYSPNARDGIFVVEVQQGVRRSPPCINQKSPTSFSSDECALVHNSADRFESAVTNRPNVHTGLSQSNSSIHTSYNYSNQQCYDNEGFGYPIYKGYVNNEPLKRLSDSRKPKITAAVYKNLGSMDVPSDGFLLSDLSAEVIIRENASLNKNISSEDGVGGTETPSTSRRNEGVNLNGLIG